MEEANRVKHLDSSYRHLRQHRLLLVKILKLFWSFLQFFFKKLCYPDCLNAHIIMTFQLYDIDQHFLLKTPSLAVLRESIRNWSLINDSWGELIWLKRNT